MHDPTDSTPIEPGNALTTQGASAPADSSVTMPEVGQRIGPNRILELIAEGGMANVYKVWHEGLEIVRAIKILKPGFNEESKQRLHTEAKISAHLHHPNIVEIYGVSFWKDAVPFMEMEYIDGFSLKDLLKYQKQAHFTLAISIGYFVCNALNYAHNQVFTLYGKPYQGVVHRDIKPANILISRSGTVKLADFGIAKPSEISLHTVGQKVMGTFSYLSPEQLNGDPLDYRCDIYSLGTVLYEMLAGVKAFPQKTISELIQKKMLNEYRPLNSFGVEVPRQLCSIIDKSIELKKEKRYSTAPEFAEDLTNLLKKYTHKTPEQIVSDYLKNPKDAFAVQRKKRISAPVVIAISMILLILVSFTSLLLVPGMHYQIRVMLARAGAWELKPASPSVHEAPVPKKNPPLPVPFVSAKDSQAFSHAAAVREPPFPSVIEEKKRQAGPSFDPLKVGLNAARQKHFNEAIPRLEAALQKNLGSSQRAEATMGLMESYLSVGDAAGALRLTNSKNINDGYYHLLCGRTFVMVGKYDRAIESFGNAQTIPSAYKTSIVREATYLWAKTLDEVFKMRPNSENKRACVRAWQQFSKAFCGKGAAEHCRDAQERIASFAR